MTISKIMDLDSTECERSLEIYKSSFPPNETRPVEKVVEMLKNDKNYQLFICLKDNRVIIAISLLYTFIPLGIGFLDYMAVSPNYQRQGVGKEIFDSTFKNFLPGIRMDVGCLLIAVQREDAPTSNKERLV